MFPSTPPDSPPREPTPAITSIAGEVLDAPPDQRVSFYVQAVDEMVAAVLGPGKEAHLFTEAEQEAVRRFEELDCACPVDSAGEGLVKLTTPCRRGALPVRQALPSQARLDPPQLDRLRGRHRRPPARVRHPLQRVDPGLELVRRRGTVFAQAHHEHQHD